MTTKDNDSKLMLNLYWGILVAALLLCSIYFIWLNDRLNTKQQAMNTLHLVAHQVDGLFTELNQITSQFENQSKQFIKCDAKAKAELSKLIKQHPYIQGISIQDTNQETLCSKFVSSHQPRQLFSNFILSGPLEILPNFPPAYVYQKKYPEVIFLIYVSAQKLENELAPKSSRIQEIALYNVIQQRIIFQLARSGTNQTWQVSQNLPKLPPHEIDKDPLLVTLPLNTTQNYRILAQIDSKFYRKITWIYGLLAIFITMATSVIIYSYTKRKLDQFFSIERTLQSALEHDRFYPTYQPIYDAQKKCYVGCEVLIRWRTATNKLILPEAFIAQAEASGQIIPITLRLMEKAFYESQEILQKKPGFYLSFNLSAMHFKNDFFFQSFSELLKKYAISPKQIMIEVTERELLDQSDVNVVNQIEKLRAAGYLLAIDDFGTGHASINYLRYFQFDYLKVDKIFIQSIGSGAITEVLNQSIIQMANNLALHIIAEGVETEAQLKFLIENQVYLMQGWFFSKEMNIEQLVSALSQGEAS